jgi:hypothetical protein
MFVQRRLVVRVDSGLGPLPCDSSLSIIHGTKFWSSRGTLFGSWGRTAPITSARSPESSRTHKPESSDFPRKANSIQDSNWTGRCALFRRSALRNTLLDVLSPPCARGRTARLPSTLLRPSTSAPFGGYLYPIVCLRKPGQCRSDFVSISKTEVDSDANNPSIYLV